MLRSPTLSTTPMCPVQSTSAFCTAAGRHPGLLRREIALHFAWMGFYSHYLGIVFFFSAAMCGIIIYRGYVDVVDGYDWANYAYQLVVVFGVRAFKTAGSRRIKPLM